MGRRWDHLQAPEVKAKRAESMRALYSDPKMRKAMVAKRLATMAKNRRSATQKKLWSDPEYKAQRLAKMAAGKSNGGYIPTEADKAEADRAWVQKMAEMGARERDQRPVDRHVGYWPKLDENAAPVPDDARSRLFKLLLESVSPAVADRIVDRVLERILK